MEENQINDRSDRQNINVNNKYSDKCNKHKEYVTSVLRDKPHSHLQLSKVSANNAVVIFRVNV
jgi:hypothetical protein